MMARQRKRPASHGPREPRLCDADLFDEAVALERLESAWAKVWSNAGAAGGDGISVKAFFPGAAQRLRRLAEALRDGRYRPGPLRHLDIPKPGGGLRPLAIPCVVDRIAQTAAADVLTPLLDAEFEPASFAYRPGRSVQQAVQQIARAREDGFTWVVDADIERYFETIPHDELIARWRDSVSDGPLTELIWTWISHAAPQGRGLAQGSPLSPLLANLYLDRLDEAFYDKGTRLVRFADDFVVLCRSSGGAEEAMAKVEGLLAERGLALNRQKSRIADFNRGFRFLGQLFVRSMVMKQAPEDADAEAVDRVLRRIARHDSAAEADAAAEQADEDRQEALGYSPGLRNLHIRTPDRRLGVRNEAFCVEQGEGQPGADVSWREVIAIPHQDVDRIDLAPRVPVTEQALRHALATDTMVAHVDGRGRTLGWTSSSLAPRAGRHMAQAAAYLDPDRRLALARRYVDARLRNQRAVLRRIVAGRQSVPPPVQDALVALNSLIGRGAKGPLYAAPDIAFLMGKEGEGTARWWRAVSVLAPAGFTFAQRDREGQDAANICLNFLAWLLARDVSVAVMRAGLHPGFGALHAVSDHRDACVFDMMEIYRAHLVGGLFVYCASRRFVRGDMFTQQESGLRMNRAAGDALIRAYEARVNGRIKSPVRGRRITWRRLMVEQAFALAAHLEDGRDFEPYVMDY
ncbi:CRISPR-associated endonuclease Cas1 [Pelagibius sp. CAU 1746]|uniref:CRISPR-associated endonuclease Cas1 n=1 Tax=Pelagibius sp. CAU 1746 TaxID=3140370 RepID=UPI00325A50FF